MLGYRNGNGQPQGIWQEKGFSYSSSFLYADQPSGQVKVGYSFYCREEQAEQGYLLPVDSKLLDSYGYPGRSCDGDARYGWHQDGRTLYCNFRNPDGEIELFAVTVKNGAIQDCQKMEETDGWFLLFARQGHLLLENQEGELYDYTKKAGLKKLGRPAAAYSNTTYVTYSAEPGFWIKSDCMVTDGLVRQLPQGEEICFLYWYEGEMTQEYLLEEKESKEQSEEWDLPLEWEVLNVIPEPFALFPKLPEQAEANKLWERTEDPAGGVERILLWQEEGEILLGFQLAEGKKCQVLTLYKENEASEVYLESLDIRKYQDVCGTSGYFIKYIEGAGARKGAYYGMKNGMLEPVLFGYNGIYEVDCDGDGQTEVISTYGTCPESWVYDYRENEIWQCSLNLLLEGKIEELTGVNRKTSVSYNEEEGQFEYSILPEEGMQNREERGALVIKTVGEHLVLKMEEY